MMRLAGLCVLAAVAVSLAACGGSGGAVDGTAWVDIRDRPELEIYDNEHTTDNQLHLLAGASGSYTVIPPYAEEHSPIALVCGIYSSSPTFEMVVHGMEHGAVAIWYVPDQLTPEELALLTEISSRHLEDSKYVIQAPYGGLETPIMLIAWGVRLPLDGVDERAINQFFSEFHDDAPEPLGAGGCATAR